MFSEKNYQRLLVLLWLIIHLLLFQHYGVRNLFDSADYIHEADYFLKYGSFEDVHHFFYAIPVLAISLFRFLFPGEILPFLIFQSMLSCIAMLALYAAGSKTFQSKTTGFISAIIFLLWWDNIHWNTTAMTESLSCSSACFLIYVLTFFQNRLRDYVLLALILLICFFTRPTGLLFILSTIFFLVHYHWSFLKARPIMRLFIFIGILVISITAAYKMFERWDFTEQLKRGNIVTYMDILEGGSLHSKDLQLDTTNLILTSKPVQPALGVLLFAIDNPVYFFKAACLKVCYLLSFVRPYYSTTHNIFSFAWVTLVYTLYFFGYQKATASIRLFSLSVIALNCALIGIASVDWDNRFFIPIEPGLVLVAGGGGEFLLRKIYSKKANKESLTKE